VQSFPCIKMVVAMNKDAISIIQQQADTDDKKQKILIVDDSKFNTFGYQYATTVGRHAAPDDGGGGCHRETESP